MDDKNEEVLDSSDSDEGMLAELEDTESDDDSSQDEVYLSSGTYSDGIPGVVRWEVSNFYNADKKPPSPLQMRKSPPVLSLQSDQGLVDIPLTKEFTNDLTSVLTDVKRAYFRAPAMRPELLEPDTRDTATKINDWIKDNPVKLTVGLVLAGFIIFAIVSPMLR